MRKPMSDVWSGEELPDYVPLTSRRMLVQEDQLTQVGRGPMYFSQKMLNIQGVVMIHMLIGPQTVGVAVGDPDYLFVKLPISGAPEYRINGESVDTNGIYLPADRDCFYSRGAERNFLCVGLPRREFFDSLASLQNGSKEPHRFGFGRLTLSRPAAVALRGELISIMDRCCDGPVAGRENAFDAYSHRVFELLLDAFLLGAGNEPNRLPSGIPKERIVRRAEEFFMESGAEKISLGHLCVAAGVGKTQLYQAFADLIGESPLSYFRKRRLTKVRSALLTTPARRGAITETASDFGFFELGRFSSEYKALFGELPSATLGKTLMPSRILGAKSLAN